MSAASSQKNPKAIQASNGYAERSIGASCAWKWPVSSTSCSSASMFAVCPVVVSMVSSAFHHSRESDDRLVGRRPRESGDPASMRALQKTLDPRIRGDDAAVSNRASASPRALGHPRHLTACTLSQSVFVYPIDSSDTLFM